MMSSPAGRVAVILVLAGLCIGRAEPPPGYYDSATNKSGLELRAALHQIIRNHRVIPYSSGSQPDTADAVALLDRDPVLTNTVRLIFNGSNALISSFGMTTGWNREHQWPNSYGIDGVQPAYSDLFNLRACDANVNSSRGNKYFDTSQTNAPGFRFPAHVEAPLCSTDPDSWEPPDFDRGNIARSLFYLAVRYTGDAVNEPLLHLTDKASLIQSTAANMGRLSTLLQWNLQDPVDLAEQLRNDLVYSLYQTNRNPFVDHPEWVGLAFGPRLTISRAVPNVLLEWSGDFERAILEATTSLNSPWTVVTNAPELMGDHWRVTLPVAIGNHYFRVRVN